MQLQVSLNLGCRNFASWPDLVIMIVPSWFEHSLDSNFQIPTFWPITAVSLLGPSSVSLHLPFSVLSGWSPHHTFVLNPLVNISAYVQVCVQQRDELNVLETEEGMINSSYRRQQVCLTWTLKQRIRGPVRRHNGGTATRRFYPNGLLPLLAPGKHAHVH